MFVFVLMPLTAKIMLFCRNNYNIIVIYTFNRRCTVTVILRCSMTVINRYSNRCHISDLVGNDDSLFAVCRRDDKLIILVKCNRFSVHRNCINIFLYYRYSLCLTVGLAVVNAGDNRACSVQHYSL